MTGRQCVLRKVTFIKMILSSQEAGEKPALPVVVRNAHLYKLNIIVFLLVEMVSNATSLHPNQGVACR